MSNLFGSQTSDGEGEREIGLHWQFAGISRPHPIRTARVERLANLLWAIMLIESISSLRKRDLRGFDACGRQAVAKSANVVDEEETGL